MNIASVRQIAELEKAAIEKAGVPELILMENAAAAVVKHCFECLGGICRPNVLIVAGKGNNGGDGLAAARLLRAKGADVNVILLGYGGGAKESALINLKMCENLKIPIEYIAERDSLIDTPKAVKACDLVVDAIFGVGLNAGVRGVYREMIDIINTHAKRVLSVDTPSGINADTGRVMEAAVKAHRTVTFMFMKTGLCLYPACEYTGETVVEDIGVPSGALLENVPLNTQVLNDAEAAALMPRRPANSHKGTFGKAAVISGCDEMPGAAVLSASAVYKAGGGLVRVCSTRRVTGAVLANVPETVTAILPEKDGLLCEESAAAVKKYVDESDVAIIGPGLGQGDSVMNFVKSVLSGSNTRMVIDADGLNALRGEPDFLLNLRAPSVITPHIGEMSRLTGVPASDIIGDTVTFARDFASRYRVCTVLKTARTVVAGPNGDVYINTTGSPAMAKAGSGDVLTGLIGAFICQGMEVFAACMLACYVHGRAGETASETLGEYGVTATDLLRCVPLVLRTITSQLYN